MVTGPSAGSVSPANNIPRQDLTSWAQQSNPGASPSMTNPQRHRIKPRISYPSGPTHAGPNYLGTISPFTFDAALTTIAIAAFLSFGLRIIQTFVPGRRKRSVNNDDIGVQSDFLDNNVDLLTEQVLPHLEKNWNDLPPYAPEITYLGFEMLWNFWKEHFLGWNVNLKRICRTYKDLLPGSRNNYRQASFAWSLVEKVGATWIKPFINAVDVGLNSRECHNLAQLTHVRRRKRGAYVVTMEKDLEICCAPQFAPLVTNPEIGDVSKLEEDLRRNAELFAEGITQHYSRYIADSSQRLEELRRSQEVISENLRLENERIEVAMNSDELQKLFEKTRKYTEKLVKIKRDMVSLQERAAKLKKRALTLQLRKQKEAYKRDQQRRMEAEKEKALIAKMSKSTDRR
ncbi:unnamed protein product [Notodromas monacha]|uniref:Uncharacterized protein n=1 Tax=Notodromas monacha TaxID=399045 RepID=A0A7R9BLF3_9CRUS|nr:unnamed protein product [Notodromas monacha]CAG0917650.1 unnamed protein product [Notodromas monacha]